MLRYATLPVLNQTCRKLLFNNFKINCPIKILLTCLRPKSTGIGSSPPATLQRIKRRTYNVYRWWMDGWKILLIDFCQEGSQMLCAKFQANWWNRLGGVRKSRFSTFCDIAKGPIPRDSAQLTEHGHIRFLNVWQSIWELLAKTHFPW